MHSGVNTGLHNMASFESSAAATTAATTAAAATTTATTTAAIELRAVQPFIEKFAEFVAAEIPELASYVAIAKMLPLETLLTRFKNEMITYGSAQNAADALFTKAGVSPTAKTRDKLVRYLQFFSDVAAVV
jgi:hypothetical protein